MKPIISLFGTAVRTDLWPRLYSSLATNTVPFELILVGDNRPNFELPENFRYIYSQVKPAQCAEIASRHALADLIMWMSDDYVLSRGALDSVYALYKSLNNDKGLVSLRYACGGEDRIWEQHFVWMDSSSPFIPMCPLMKKSLWRQLGGIDRRFIASCWDMDIDMRVYEAGGEAILSQDAYAEEDHFGPTIFHAQSLWREYGVSTDRPLLDSFWVKDGVVVKNRLSPVEPFTDDILQFSQGNKGRWP